MSLNSSEKLILALDGMDKVEVLELINKLPDLSWVKVGVSDLYNVEIIEGLSKGLIDAVIGTHQLLSKAIEEELIL